MMKGTQEKLYLAEESKSRASRKLGETEKRPKDATSHGPKKGLPRSFHESDDLVGELVDRLLL